MEVLPHETTAIRRAIKACIETEKPVTAEILLGMMRRWNMRCADLEAKAAKMPRER